MTIVADTMSFLLPYISGKSRALNKKQNYGIEMKKENEERVNSKKYLMK